MCLAVSRQSYHDSLYMNIGLYFVVLDNLEARQQSFSNTGLSGAGAGMGMCQGAGMEAWWAGAVDEQRGFHPYCIWLNNVASIRLVWALEVKSY